MVSIRCLRLAGPSKGSGQNSTCRTILPSRTVKKEVCIEVRDTGPGISSDDLPRLFSEFKRLKATAHTEGTGLGLSLSYDIVKAHGGELKVETKEGVGTTFIINLG